MASNPGRSPRPARTSASGRNGAASGGDPTNQPGQTPADLFGLAQNYHTGAPGSAGGHGSSDVTTQTGQLDPSIEGDNGVNALDTGSSGASGASPNSGGESVSYTDSFALQGYGNDASGMSSPNAVSGLNDSTGWASNGFSGPTLPGLENSRNTDTGAGKGRIRGRSGR